jgi:hypothetical protein
VRGDAKNIEMGIAKLSDISCRIKIQRWLDIDPKDRFSRRILPITDVQHSPGGDQPVLPPLRNQNVPSVGLSPLLVKNNDDIASLRK